MIAITGPQFVRNGDDYIYIVTGINPTDLFLSATLPNGWDLVDFDPISGTTQNFYIEAGIGSGTFIFTYEVGGVITKFYYDVFCSSTRRGEQIAQNGAIFIPSSTNIVPPVICGISRCPYTLEVFADEDEPANELNNDKSDFYFYGNAGVASIAMTLQKLVSGTWTDSVVLNSSAYGSFFAFGKHPDFSGADFTDDFGKQYTGIFLNWLTVLQNKGFGTYRMKIVYTDIFAVASTYYSQAQYALYQWNCYKPNGTVRIELFNEGLRGSLEDNRIQIDYSTGWRSQIRLRGLFLYKGSSYVKEYNQYGDADYNAFKPIIHEQSSKYSLTKLQVPAWLIWYLSTNVNQADSILITDYNTSNRFALVKTPVMSDGDIALNDNNLTDPTGSILISTKLNFAYSQNNLRKRNS